MILRLEIILVCATMLLGAGCAHKTQTQKDLEDINRVITGIEARKEMELRVIRNELKNISLLQENQTKVNSDGMRDKISREIVMKESVIEKAKNNKANQEQLLGRLYTKRDSILALQEISQ